MRINFTKKKDLIRRDNSRGITNPKDANYEYGEYLCGIINWLIINLYELNDETVYQINKEKLKKYRLENETINWGDLSCYQVNIEKDKYVIHIEEALSYSNNFKNYIAKYLKKWGWDDVKIITEW